MPPAPIVMADRTWKKNPRNIIGLTMLGKHCLLAERDIGAPIYWRTDAPCATTIGAPMPPGPIVLAHWKRNNLHVNNAGVTSFTSPIGGPNQKKFKKRRTEQFGVPHLFSYQSPINWALQTGNGNTLKKRRCLLKKIYRQRSPRSDTTFEHLPASRPPHFSLVSRLTTFKPCEIFSLWSGAFPLTDILTLILPLDYITKRLSDSGQIIQFVHHLHAGTSFVCSCFLLSSQILYLYKCKILLHPPQK